MSAPTNIAYINPEVLNWARTRSGFSYPQLEAILRISQEDFTAWERSDPNGTTTNAIRHLLWGGEVPFVRLGKRHLVSTRDLDQWIQPNTVRHGTE